MMIVGLNKCNQCEDALTFSKNYPLQTDATLQEIRSCQWENVVNSAGKKQLKKVLKENLLIICMTHFVHNYQHLLHTITSNKNKVKLISKI